MGSRWQANKIGLVNFWYYDEQEFPFVKGRMLLRGSNGSGKSVTMQSVVPLLLDGNMSPERLDPFGSRDRKMSSYLLEEDDGREERTGYLYLEFKRQESETYLTVGMGIRARRGKPLDKWYFSLTDGRRVGKDFFLYKETDEKVTLSKKELEYRVANGGRTFDRQVDYMEYVNRQVFGFETVDEYKEMIDLLIQLRTPKLSKDFKPSVINDILSDSLQPLSDEDLRPMSEAIENMDTMNLNLKARREGRQAAEKINRVFDKYNRLTLYEKAARYEENEKKLANLLKEEKERGRKLRECEERVQWLAREEETLNAKKGAMEKERESLSKSDAVALKEKEMELAARIEKDEKNVAEKERQLAAKQEQYVELSSRQKEEQDREYQKEQGLRALLEEMQDEADDMAFEEHAFFSAELLQDLQKPFLFGTHQAQMEKTRTGIEKGLEILREADAYRRQVEDLLQKHERQQQKTGEAERRAGELEAVMAQVQNEWKEALYSWSGRNQELVLSKELLKSLSRFVEEYDENSDYAAVRQPVADVWIEKKGKLAADGQKTQARIQELCLEKEEQERELAEWENHKEPEPPRDEAVQRNRARLRDKNIPYQEFYKVIEFGEGLDKTACDRIEEAFLRMGILDALVIEEQYREQVLALDQGCCDKYLFVQKAHAEKSVLDVLDLNDSVNDIFFNQRITGILQNIAYESEGATSVSLDGTYQIGVISGTISGEHEAGFLGTRAREQNRLAKIAACRKALESIGQELARMQGEAEEIGRRQALLAEEYAALPREDDLREACRMLSGARLFVERMKEEEVRLEAELREKNEALREMRKEALQIAEGLYLDCNYETFLRAAKAAGNYGQHFYQLKSEHEIYVQVVGHIAELFGRMEDLDLDMDQIRADMRAAGSDLKKGREEYASVQEQLKLTDYEQIRERLDVCIRWLGAYPQKVGQCAAEKGQKEEQIRTITALMEQGTGQMEEYRRRSVHLQKCYEAEAALGYVELPGNEGMEGRSAGQGARELAVSGDAGQGAREFAVLGDKAQEAREVSALKAGDAAAVRAFLAVDCQELDKEAVIRDLNKVYFENRGFLNDYQLTQTERFTELDEEARPDDATARRLDIGARYQGVRIPFQKLLGHLEEEIEELQELIKAGDRELFEDILANTVSRKIRGKINSSNTWVEKMNGLMQAMNTSSGLKLSLRWRSKTAEHEDQLDTRELVDLLKKDYRLMREDEAAKLSLHFRSKVEEARRHAKDSGGMVSFYQVMKETLDYRRWFEFQLFSQKIGERQKELTNSVFGTFSGGEKAMSMYVPLFSAVVAKYKGGNADAPRLISLDEAFAGVDNKNIRDMFRLMTEFEFDFIINSQVLWGDCDTLDALAIYQLLRPENAKFVTVMPYLWNGRAKEMLENESQMEERMSESRAEK